MSIESELRDIEETIDHHHGISPDSEPTYYETEENLAAVRAMLLNELGAEAIKEASA